MYTTSNYYSNSKSIMYDGFMYDSKFEAGYAMELDLRLKAKDIKSWDRQKVLDLIVNEYIICTYKIDFIVYHHDGIIEYIETKGYATPTWKLKWKLFEAIYSVDPNVKLSLVFQGKTWNPRMRKIKKPIKY